MRKLDNDSVLEVVRRYNTLTYSKIADKLGVNRSSIGRFFKKYPEVLEKAKKILDEKENLTAKAFSENSSIDIEVFLQIPIIREWNDLLNRRNIAEDTKRQYLFGVMRVCNALNVHPARLDVDYVADQVFEWKEAQDNDLDYPYGCAYNTIRKPLRSFFSLMYGISGEQLTMKGIGAEHTEGFGQAAKEKITIRERAEIIKHLRSSIVTVFEDEGVDTRVFPVDDYYLEMVGIMVWMYYTATRITSSLDETRFNDPKNDYQVGEYTIHVIDKGKKGGIHWNKKLVGNAYDVFSKYVQERFNIPVEAQLSVLPSFDSPLFPLLCKDKRLETKVMKQVQQDANAYKITMVNHLWRHTFAQDWLEAMEGNYEVGAEVGGWKDIGTMKRCYGAVSERVIKRGLNKAMGLPVGKEDHKLRFIHEDKDKWFYRMIKTRGENK